MNDFEKFGRGLAEAGKQCAQKEIEMYKCLEKRNEMLEPVYENFWENLRKVQNYHSAALHHLLVYKHNYERFECCLNNIWFFEKHSFVCAAQIKNMFASHNVEERRTNHGEVVVRMETLLFETDRAIKNIIDSWEDEKKQHDPSKADGYEGSVIIEEIDDKVLEKKSDIIEVADEIGELKNEFAKMSTQIDEIREMVRNVCQLIQVQTENCDQKRGNYRNRSVEATALEPARSEERSKKSYDCDDTKSSNVLVELTCEDCSCPQAEPRFERESYEYSRECAIVIPKIQNTFTNPIQIREVQLFAITRINVIPEDRNMLKHQKAETQMNTMSKALIYATDAVSTITYS
ncbi:unnamed protein product [Caenorhabditis brenneri]